MLDEIAVWVLRLARALPEFMGLWQAVQKDDPKEKLDAQLALVRAVEDQVALEEIARGQ